MVEILQYHIVTDVRPLNLNSIHHSNSNYNIKDRLKTKIIIDDSNMVDHHNNNNNNNNNSLLIMFNSFMVVNHNRIIMIWCTIILKVLQYTNQGHQVTHIKRNEEADGVLKNVKERKKNNTIIQNTIFNNKL